MRILLSDNNQNLLYYTRDLLKYFVKSFQYLYGAHFISHNVHGILHLCDDYERYGPLDTCSTFPFENYMKVLKKMLHKMKNLYSKLLDDIMNYAKMNQFNLLAIMN